MYGRIPLVPVDKILGTEAPTFHKNGELEEFRATLIKAIREAREQATEHAKKAREDMKTQYDKHERVNPIREGDLVFLKKFAINIGEARKLTLSWTGYFRVEKIPDPDHVIISNCAVHRQKPRRVHITQVKLAIPPAQPIVTTTQLTEEENRALENANTTEDDVIGIMSHDMTSPSKEPEPTEPSSNDREPRYNLRPHKPPKFSLIFDRHAPQGALSADRVKQEEELMSTEGTAQHFQETPISKKTTIADVVSHTERTMKPTTYRTYDQAVQAPRSGNPHVYG
ncbi:unnamed protein product [Caenorhabditis bovis]|uniref:Uncharacterized protein n=1 Tax=Caenorhabditis bovis TaxID=2654633 RepID=A0A8S1FBA9_9PELO|nr:unnamed protein product [Caenorhabditis bovis]